MDLEQCLQEKRKILFLQETKLYAKGQIKLQNFFIFETNRTQGGGGGLITAVHEKFNPTLIEGEQDNPDVLIVQCKIGSNSVSLINGYDPQETDAINERMQFFTCFETAIQSSMLNGNLICCELDANSKIGIENIPLDIHKISANGQLLMDIVKRNDLIIVNSTKKCTGTFTRVRKTKVLDEKSIIDYFLVCRRFYELILSLEIDEDRKFVLTKYATRMGTTCVIESDHNPLICKLNIKWDNRIRCERKEVFKIKDTKGLNIFN